eukprot:GHVP01059622.1.p1 GENE.GHVP01059622.1~~GHVP01059622.1.p1  ORF type:complete len:124 (-),score=12.06 GHVP01059622.1:615-986(-)
MGECMHAFTKQCSEALRVLASSDKLGCARAFEDSLDLCWVNAESSTAREYLVRADVVSGSATSENKPVPAHGKVEEQIISLNKSLEEANHVNYSSNIQIDNLKQEMAMVAEILRQYLTNPKPR